jgi:pimeloyl-ACP methyl ester carboxylesterase
MLQQTHAYAAVVGDLRIVYDDAGAGTTAVMLIHGGFANRTHLAPQFSHLSRRHRVLALDLRGHGDSGVPVGGFRMRDFAEDVIAVCETAEVDRAVLCGHSMSGAIALEVAAARPELVAGVAMLDAAILFPDAIRAQALTNLVPALEGEGWVDALRGYFMRAFGPYDSPALKTRVMEEIGTTPRQMAAPLMRDLMSSDFGAQLSSGKFPLLFVHAKTPADLARLQHLRPDALIGSVVGSGHYLSLQVPDQVNAMLDRFLEIVASRG